MKLSDRAKQIISAVAPTLGATLGGPLGGLAGNILAKTLGADPSDSKTVEDAILSQSPEIIANIRLAEIDLEKAAQANEIELERVNAGDRANARAREIATGDWTTKILAYTVVGSFCALVFAVLFHQVTAESTIAGAVIGYLSAKAEQVIAYYFGSSAGSKAKTDALTNLAQK